MSAFIPAPPEAWAAATTPTPDAVRVALGCPAWCALDPEAHEVGVQRRGDGRVLLAVDHGADSWASAYLTSTAWLVPDGAGLRIEVEPVALVVEVEPRRFTDAEQVRVLAAQLHEAADALAAAQAVTR